MKKTYFFNLFLLFTGLIYGQTEKLNKYTASNGITYIVGDTIQLNVGTKGNGYFNYVQYGGLDRSKSGSISNYVDGIYEHTKHVLRKIRTNKDNVFDGNTYFVLYNSYFKFHFYVDIEKAIESCEVLPCNKEVVNAPGVTTTDDKYEKLKQLKILFDEGVLTEDEFNNEKAKILNTQ